MQSIYGKVLTRSAPAFKLPEPERQSLLNSLTSTVGSGVEALGLFLDTPGAIARGVLAGKPLSGFSFDNDTRVSGSELLKSYGYQAPKRIFGSRFLGRASDFTTGLATEIALDPLWLFGSGINAMTKAGRVLAKTPYLDDIQRIAQRANIDTVLDGNRSLGAYSVDQFYDPIQKELDDAAALLRQTKYGNVLADKFAKQQIRPTRGIREVAPPIGPRLARATMTPRQVVEFAGETDLPLAARQTASRTAKEQIEQAARALGTSYDEIADQNLGGLFRAGVGDTSVVFNPKAGLPYLDAIDALGARIKYSSPIVRAAPYFQKRVDEATTLPAQLSSLRRNQLADAKSVEISRQIADHTAIAKRANEEFQRSDEIKRLIGSEDLFDPKSNDMLTRIAEGVPEGADEIALAKLPSLQEWRDSWVRIRDDLVKLKEEVGIDVAEYGPDHFGVEWSPRQAYEANFEDLRRSPTYRSERLGVETESEMARSIRSPGGTVDIRRLSVQPKVLEFVEKFASGKGPSEREMKRWVVKEIGKMHNSVMQPITTKDGQRVYKMLGKSKMASKEAGENIEYFFSDDDARSIVGLFKRYDPEYARRGIPLFSATPVKSQQRAMRAAGDVVANAEYVYETLAENAIRQRKTTIPGSGYRRLGEALNATSKQLGLARKMVEKEFSGVSQMVEEPAEKVLENLKERLLKLLSLDDPAMTSSQMELDLNEWSVPESVVNMLTDRISSYVDPIAKKTTSNFFNSFTALFKNTVLARPARFARDLYSNAFSILWETGSIPATIKGFRAAQQIIAGDPKEAFEYLKSLPKFAGARYKTIQDITDEIARDVSQTKLLGGLASSDLFNQNSILSISEYYPGAMPKTVSGSLADNFSRMIPSEDRTLRDIGRDFLSVRGVGFGGKAPEQTYNPLFRASEEIGDTVDSWARLGGYLALLSQGNSVEQAAKRMKKAMVDYSTLTNFEREKLVKFWLPWWSYNSRIASYVGETLLNNPGGRLAQTVRGFTNLGNLNEENYIPTSIRQNVGIKLSDGGEVDRYLTGIDLPGFDALSILQPSRSFPLAPDVQGTMRNIALQLGPIPRAAMELAANTDTFTGRPLSEADTTANRVYQSIVGKDKAPLSPLTKVALSNLPFVQFFEPFLRPAFDDRIESGDKLGKFLTNYMSGLKVQDVDRGYRLRDQMRLLSPELEGVTRTFPIQYVPQDRKQALTPDEQNWVDLQSDLRRLLELEP